MLLRHSSCSALPSLRFLSERVMSRKHDLSPRDGRNPFHQLLLYFHYFFCYYVFSSFFLFIAFLPARFVTEGTGGGGIFTSLQSHHYICSFPLRPYFFLYDRTNIRDYCVSFLHTFVLVSSRVV